ncbi:TPA: hypothetical protein N0F65_012319 [Lagenidium giganteum]|uniref:Retinol dehydrogenase 12 n=1 Tax=Lagenidium giganteum TaxID=4803 RepID=A0AAV2YNX7_9STRA|nr:TPA: hypothetical protein N0F65_012319 [Lagenidium giganteum]
MHWDAATAMPRQDGKIVVITGANTGIGYDTALQFVAKGAHVVMACRNTERAQQARTAICKDLDVDPAKAAVEVMALDVGDEQSIRGFAKALQAKFDRLDVLISNAGVALPTDTLTSAGKEPHFAVNHLGHFLLTALLFDLLKRSASARIVVVSSFLHHVAWLDFASWERHDPSSWWNINKYATSKLANLLFAYELHRRLQAAEINNIRVIAVHPGTTRSTIFTRWVDAYVPVILQWLALWILAWLPQQTTRMGALPTLFATTDSNAESGAYYGPHRFFHGYPVRVESSSTSHSIEHANQLWELSERMTSHKFNV